MTHLRITLLSAVLITLRLSAVEVNWPEFRGPHMADSRTEELAEGQGDLK